VLATYVDPIDARPSAAADRAGLITGFQADFNVFHTLDHSEEPY
jgi:hypothetical protein